MTIWRSLTVARMAGLGQLSAIHSYKTKKGVVSLLVNNEISIIGFTEVHLRNQELHCFQVLYKVTIANYFKLSSQLYCIGKFVV